MGLGFFEVLIGDLFQLTADRFAATGVLPPEVATIDVFTTDVFFLAKGEVISITMFLSIETLLSPVFKYFFFFVLGFGLFRPLAEVKVSSRILALDDSADSSLREIIFSGDGFFGISSGSKLMTLGALSFFKGVLKSDL